MVLAHVQLEVGDPPGVLFVEGQRRGPSAWPTCRRVRSAALATTARRRSSRFWPASRRRSRHRSAPPHGEDGLGRVQRGIDDPHVQGGRIARAARLSRTGQRALQAAAPPCQHAATPMPPQAKPGRTGTSRAAPTGIGRGAVEPDGGAGDGPQAPRNPALGGSASPTGAAGTRNSWRSAPTWAVTRRASSRAASEHHGLTR